MIILASLEPLINKFSESR